MEKIFAHLVNGTWFNNNPVSTLNEIEDKCKEAATLGFIDPLDKNTYRVHTLFQFVLNDPSNAPNANHIRQQVFQGGKANSYRYWYCTLLKLMRNYCTHHQTHQKELDELAAKLPSKAISWCHKVVYEIQRFRFVGARNVI